MARKIYGLTEKDRAAVREVIRRIGGGVGRPSRRPTATRRRSRETRGVETHWGIVASGGISALSGTSGSTLTPGSGTVQEYNSDGTIKTGITETWKNWMNVAIPQHTPVMGNRESDGQIWVKVAPCGTLPTS